VHDPLFLAFAHAQTRCAVEGKRQDSPCTGCLTFHHIRTNGSPKDDRRGFVLCSGHHLHQSGPHSIERLGKVKFERFFGVSIEHEIAALNARHDEAAG
jgi:hypothetical protein